MQIMNGSQMMPNASPVGQTFGFIPMFNGAQAMTSINL
jgi:hypothetical protein